MNWLNQHAQALKLVLSRFGKNKLSTLLICLAIATSLAIPSVLYMTLSSLKSLASGIQTDSKMSVFMALSHDENAVATLENALKQNPNIASITFVSKQEAFKNLMQSGTYGNTLESLEENPLPDAFFITPKQIDAASLNQLKNEIGALPNVADILIDSAWIKRLNYLVNLGQKAMLVLALLLGFGLFTVIGNTIRMQILTQRDEIELSQLIGATKTFIRRPFLHAGMLYGLLGGLLAVAITCSVIMLFNQSVAPLAAEYQTQFLLRYPNVLIALMICGLAIVVGLISSYLAVTQSLYKFTVK